MLSNDARAQGEERTVAEGAPKRIPEVKSVVLDRSDPAFLGKAYGLYDEMRAKGPVVQALQYPMVGDIKEQEAVMKGERPIHEVLFVSHYKEAADALTDERLSSDPYVMSTPEQRAQAAKMPMEFRPIAHSLLVMDPPDHTRLRRLVQPAFNARAMEALKPRVQRLTDELLDKAAEAAAARGESAPDRRMELIKAFAYPLPVQVISDMLGIPEEDREEVQKLAELRVEGLRNPTAIEENRKSIAAFSNYLRELFERKRQKPADDMITQMVQAREEGDKLSDEELLSMVFILYFAGHVTTVNLIGNGVVALLTHPDQLGRFKADPALVKGVVEETLRYWSPVDYLGGNTKRVAKEDMELGGAPIPKGASLAIGLSAANRDPKEFKDPDTYDISRAEAARHIAFGKGIHLCLGAPLARIEGQIAFETLFRRLPDLRLAVSEEELRWGGAAGLRGFRDVPVLF